MTVTIRCTCGLLGDPLRPFAQCPSHPDPPRCRGCIRFLKPENATMADGCPCNSPRGINHGLVPSEVCCCKVCDPTETGASRQRPQAEPLRPSKEKTP